MHLSSLFQPTLWVTPAALCPSPHQRFPPSPLDSPRPTQPFRTMKSFKDSKTFRAEQALQSIPGALRALPHPNVLLENIKHHPGQHHLSHSVSQTFLCISCCRWLCWLHHPPSQQKPKHKPLKHCHLHLLSHPGRSSRSSVLPFITKTPSQSGQH